MKFNKLNIYKRSHVNIKTIIDLIFFETIYLILFNIVIVFNLDSSIFISV